MKRYFPLVLITIVALFVHMGCEFTGMGLDERVFHNVHIRNMSTISGVTFYHGTRYQSTYLNQSPQAGTPVDKTIELPENVHGWWVERAIDSVVVDSGVVDINCEKWLLIEGDSTGWTCTWSNSGW
jgi:hypothetical protein